jgi:hypothetical protein
MALNAGGSSCGAVFSMDDDEILANIDISEDDQIFDDASNSGGSYVSSGGGDSDFVDASAGDPSDTDYTVYKSVTKNNKQDEVCNDMIERTRGLDDLLNHCWSHDSAYSLSWSIHFLCFYYSINLTKNEVMTMAMANGFYKFGY